MFLFGLIGLILIIFSYLMNLTAFMAEPWGLIIPHYLFIIGAWMLLEFINSKLNHKSLFLRLMKKDFLAVKIVGIGFLAGAVFEFYGVFISNLWHSYFQNWSPLQQMIHYPLGILVGYGLPALVYYDLYQIVSYFAKNQPVKKIKLHLGWFKCLLFLGVAFLLIPLILYPFSFSWHPLLRGLLFGFCLIGIWLILEFFEIQKHENTFIMILLKHNFKPLVAVIICSVIISLSWEFLNSIRPSWIYQNLPFMEATILGIPLGVILGWPLLFVIYFSFYNLCSKNKEQFW